MCADNLYSGSDKVVKRCLSTFSPSIVKAEKGVSTLYNEYMPRCKKMGDPELFPGIIPLTQPGDYSPVI